MITGVKNKIIHLLLKQLSVSRPIDLHVGTLSEAEQAGLRDLLNESAGFPGPIIEIGTLIGVTTINLALWAPQDKKVITVDNYAWNAWGLSAKEHFDLAQHALSGLVRLGKVEQIVMEKAEFYRDYDGGPPSLVFLDAIHTYEETMKDINWAKGAAAGIICGHDYSKDWPGVIQAVEESGGARKLYGSVWCL